ncbi:hypothetical protein PENTCL1PPCAC_1928 [Pristionchus entomophagus]|uniref:Uncharacterized protein n=1 Tax=Pristionchus entomophagus TaxID=358040 RepID=A0AAV5SGE3_9BILA|nr:hypothetical protein PENTCL1PPCAC_1928 [Pristionchus entomophagus]
MAAQVGEPPTVATDESLSQPSTSAGTNEEASMKEGEAEAERDPSSDSDASIGWGDYEHRKDVIVKRLVLYDQFMNRMKVTAKFTRLKDYEKRKEDVKNRTDPEYLARVAAMEKEVEKEQDKKKTQFDLELEALERANEGENDLIDRGYRDRLQYKKSQLMYDQSLKINEIVKRIWREDVVRADVRLFVGEDVPDEWLDEFVKTYVDELDDDENGEEAVRQRNLKRYRRDAGESLDMGQSVWGILEKAEAVGHWACRPTLKRLSQSMYDEEEMKEMERRRRKERQKIVDQRLKSISHKRIGRFFSTKIIAPPAEKLVGDSELRDGEWMKKERIEKRRKEMKEEKTEGKERSMKQSEWERREIARQEQIRLKTLERMELEKSEESGSDEEKLDLAATVRQGVRAVLMTYGRPASIQSERREKRVGRLKTALRTVLEMKRQFGADPELQQARETLMDKFVVAMRKERAEGVERSDEDMHLMGEETVEEEVRDSSLVRGLMRKSVKRPMGGGGPWIDERGRARGAIERERKRRTHLNTLLSSIKKDQFRKPKWTVDSSSEWEDVEGEEKKSKKNKKRMRGGIENNLVSAMKSNAMTISMNGMSEKEKMEKEKKLREIMAVIEGKNPMEIEETEMRMMEEEEKKVEGERVQELDGGMKRTKNKNGRRLKKPVRRFDSGSSDDEEYGSERKKTKGYGNVPLDRLAVRPPVQQTRLRLQLSHDRILKDLYKSGALRQRETYGEYLERMDKERRQRLLSSLPSTSTGNYGSRVNLLSPRSQLALEEIPEEAMKRLTNSERKALLEGLPSTSRNDDYSWSDEEREVESDEEEELSEGWELEEEVEEEEKEVKEEDEDEMMEVDNGGVVDGEVVREEEEVNEEMEEPRKDDIGDGSPPNAVGASPLLLESTTKKKKSAPRMNGFSRTGTATAV